MYNWCDIIEAKTKYPANKHTLPFQMSVAGNGEGYMRTHQAHHKRERPRENVFVAVFVGMHVIISVLRVIIGSACCTVSG